MLLQLRAPVRPRMRRYGCVRDPGSASPPRGHGRGPLAHPGQLTGAPPLQVSAQIDTTAGDPARELASLTIQLDDRLKAAIEEPDEQRRCCLGVGGCGRGAAVPRFRRVPVRLDGVMAQTTDRLSDPATRCPQLEVKADACVPRCDGSGRRFSGRMGGRGDVGITAVRATWPLTTCSRALGALCCRERRVSLVSAR